MSGPSVLPQLLNGQDWAYLCFKGHLCPHFTQEDVCLLQMGWDCTWIGHLGCWLEPGLNIRLDAYGLVLERLMPGPTCPMKRPMLGCFRCKQNRIYKVSEDRILMNSRPPTKTYSEDRGCPVGWGPFLSPG